eukprot:scaffold18318_cov53-Isochrysis_galbana.AAC.1
MPIVVFAHARVRGVGGGVTAAQPWQHNPRRPCRGAPSTAEMRLATNSSFFRMACEKEGGKEGKGAWLCVQMGVSGDARQTMRPQCGMNPSWV